MVMERGVVGRNLIFLLFLGLSLLLFFRPMELLVVSSLGNELYSHIVLIPLVSLFLIFSRRREIFTGSSFSPVPGILLIICGLAVHMFWRGRSAAFDQNDFLSLMVFTVVVCWLGGFILCYGIEASRKALFPLLFLLFMVPVPSCLMDRIIFLLQYFSAEVSFSIFKLTNVPIYREGFTFFLPGLAVEVAKQCGGIRSSLALFITSILAGHLFLRTRWGKLFLAVAGFPITIIKNSVRIVFLSLYGAYVDRGILSGMAHRRGGIPFFFIALALLGVVLFAIRRFERRSESGGEFLEFGKEKT